MSRNRRHKVRSVNFYRYFTIKSFKLQPLYAFMANLDPNHYIKYSKIQLGLAAELIEKISFKGDERLLDIGSGDGKITAFLQELVPNGEVVGVDSSEEMIAFARDLFPHIKFEKQDAEEMVFIHPFDLITSFNALHWVSQPKKAAKQMFNALKPGGRAYILTFPYESPYWRPLEKTLQNPLFSAYASQAISFLTTEEYRTVFKEAGFILESLELEDRIVSHSSPEELKKYIQGWLPSYLSLPEDLSGIFLDLTVQNYCGHKSESDFPYKKLTLSLIKS